MYEGPAEQSGLVECRKWLQVCLAGVYGAVCLQRALTALCFCKLSPHFCLKRPVPSIHPLLLPLSPLHLPLLGCLLLSVASFFVHKVMPRQALCQPLDCWRSRNGVTGSEERTWRNENYKGRLLLYRYGSFLYFFVFL